MNEIKNFKIKDIEFEIGSFDSEKEIEFCMSDDNMRTMAVWMNSNQVNELINHLVKCLKFIKEPIEVLNVAPNKCAKCGASGLSSGKPFCTDNFCNG